MTDQMMIATHESEQVIEEVDHNIKEDTMLSNPSSPRAAESDDLVGEIMAIIESLKTVGEFRKTQRKECHNLVRRLKLFMPVLEEIRDVDGPISDAGMECLKRLHKAFQSARKLLKLCHGGSKLFLALESEAMMVRFHTVYGKISQAVEGMPYDELGISEEEKEQIELLRVQLRRARKRTDTQDMELTMDLMVALSKDNDRNADKASIERLANKLGLHTADELKMETLAVQKLVKDRRGPSPDTAQQTVYLLEKLRQLGGLVGKGVEDVEHQQVTDDSVVKSTSSIPNEFLCPITLEIMTDPVIVATGQTYERESIQKWLDSCHKTCPKTGQILTHLSLAPNFALKNLIVQWCEKNNFHLPKKETPESTESLSTTDDEQILSLIQNLSSNTLDEQRQAVKKIRLLSKENPENRIMIANGGGIPPLVHLLSYPDSKIQEHSVTALLNLSIDDSNKRLISKNEPIPSIIEILHKGTVCGKENSAAALFSLSMLDENKVKIGYLNGIPPLVELLKSGTIRGKKDAVTALFNLCMNNSNKTRAIEAGIVTPLLKVLEDEKLEMVNETLSLLLILAGNLDGRQELGKLPFIESLVNFIRDGTNKNKECATAVLLELASSNHNLILAALQFGVYEHLVEVSKNGTERGQRKANALLRLMRNTEQIP